MQTTITIRTDSELKEAATKLFEGMGLNLSSALNIFMRQAVLNKRFPCAIDSMEIADAVNTYPEGFFNLFGSAPDLECLEEDDLPIKEVEL